MIAMDVWCPWELATLNKQRHESRAHVCLPHNVNRKRIVRRE